MPWDPLGLSALARPLSQAAPLPNILASEVQRIQAAGDWREVLNHPSTLKCAQRNYRKIMLLLYSWERGQAAETVAGGEDACLQVCHRVQEAIAAASTELLPKAAVLSGQARPCVVPRPKSPPLSARITENRSPPKNCSTSWALLPSKTTGSNLVSRVQNGRSWSASKLIRPSSVGQYRGPPCVLTILLSPLSKLDKSCGETMVAVHCVYNKTTHITTMFHLDAVSGTKICPLRPCPFYTVLVLKIGTWCPPPNKRTLSTICDFRYSSDCQICLVWFFNFT